MYLPDGLLTSGFLKHDVEINPHIIAPDPFASDDCLDVFSPVYQFLPLELEELNTMNPSEDEPSSGLNGRLRPRKSAIPSPLSIKQIVHKYDGKQAQEKPKRSSTPSKASPSKPEDLPNNSNLLPSPQLLCPYCDRKFVSKQTVSKHIRRLHLSASKIESSIVCLFCNHVETEPSDIIRHMIDNHPNQYFACLDCHTRFPSTKELAEHKLNICEKQKIPYRSKLRRKTTKKSQKALDSQDKDDYSSKNFGHGFNGIVISCELKPAHIHDEADIEDNITTNLILPPSKNISTSAVLEKNAVIVLDDIQWNRRIPSNFSFHNTDADQILSRLGVVHRSPKTGESTKKDWFRAIEDATQKFEKCFDTSFYSKVASNVQENLTKFLDGSFNFNPDPDSTIKTRKSKNSVIINTAEGFPILLACEQYSRNTYDGFIPRTIAPKHKWKWDTLENEKPWNPDQIKRDTHANNCIITLVSSLDIWTQLRMRRKFEDKFNITPVEKKTEKQNVISKELKEILESREIPASSNSQISSYVSTPLSITNEENFPTSLGLMPSVPNFNVKPAILSGEWVRPRCYVCCACGAQSRDSRALSVHVSSKHPNAQVQHYEIVGESLLKADILKHLYVPPSQNINRTRPPRGFRDCTKCMKSITIEDLHQHMLDCAGDTPTVRRKCRYRPFGVRRRRPRLPDNRIRKKMRNDIRTRTSRQKNRMRPKPKIRSEVGDAETIRKMLADLPAKRHRVLVNPLNSILRPRRKLDKQRAMLMMKRHTSEDLKSGKTKPSNTMHYDHQQRSTNIDKYKSVSNRDDEDNQPLKSRLKRVACNITRQKESLTRKAMLKKPKRKVRLLIEKKESEGLENDLDMSMSCPVKVQNDELSVDHNEKRINVNEDPKNIREHSSGREDPNNGRRDNQRPGCSGQNGNSRNVCAPAQNVPLKHSIARLTANSETHDKSVQFHHLFLVQQECNNTNEHVPTGQRVFFENEAVVTKLDKPPLHFNQKNSLESVEGHRAETIQENNLESIQAQTLDSIQKNKLNKPRKGLNDCIAMLKNKLVDTDPNAPAHVSVQCGTDDLLSPDPALTSISTKVSPRADVVVKSVQVCPSTEQPKKSSSKNLARNEQLPKPSPVYRGEYFNHDIYGQTDNEKQTAQWRPVNYDAIMPRYADNRSTRKETSRRRSASQHENIFISQQILTVSPPKDDMLIKLSSDSYNTYNLPPRKSPKSFSEQFSLDSNKILTKFGKRKIFDKNTPEASNGSLQSCEKSSNNHTEKNKKPSDSAKKSTRTRVSSSRKPVEALEKHINIRKDVPKSVKESNEKCQIKSVVSQSQRDPPLNNLGEKKNEDYPQVLRRKKSMNVNADVSLSQFKQGELQLKADLNVKMPTNVYAEHNLNDNQVTIPLAHASTNVESMLSVPLDLSSKALSVDCDYSSRHVSTVLVNYDTYETLDLSNKRRTSIEHLSEDEVVDLRVKHNSDYPRSAVLKPACPSLSEQGLNTVAALNLVHQNECVPTDLSLKRKAENTNICMNLCQKINIDETQIQDLSKNKTKTVSSADCLVVDDELPTDLSNKKVIHVEDVTMAVKESKNDGYENHTNFNNLNLQDRLNNMPEKVNDKTPSDCNIQILKAVNHVMPEQITKINDNSSYDDEIQVTPETSNSFSTISQIQKPIYDPTLRIPQYKIRPAGINTISRESNVTVASSLTTISTSPESFSSHQSSINNSHSTCRSHNSTAMNNSIIASIEAQERITYSFTKSVLHTTVTSMTGSLPAYSLLKRGITTPFTTFESTRPVYALPNACISMAKIDVTTNSLLSIPSTTIMSTSPVYTLAGTTIVTPLNYVTLPSTGQAIPYPPPCGAYLPEIDSQIMTHYTSPSSANIQEGRSYDHNVLIRGAMFNFERDHENSRQVVTLPKEIVAILKTMPFDHRNQLLDVLSHYLSASRPIPILSSQTSLFPSAGPNILTMPIRLSRELSVDASTDTVDIKPLQSLQTDENQCQLKQNGNSSRKLLHSSVQHASQVFHNQVIDLTYDDIVPKIDIDSEVNDEQQILSIEEIPVSITTTSNMPKTNNEKTASLRAVRIKAPSERQQLKIIANSVESLSCTEFPVAPSNDNYDNELHQPLNTDISSDIQMYEVSSTQSSKNKLSDSELYYKIPKQPVCDSAMKVRGDLVVAEHSENIQSQLLKQNHVQAISLHKPVCNMDIISKGDLIVKKHDEDMQPQLLEHNSMGTISSDSSVICHETNDAPILTKNIDLINNTKVDSSNERRLTEIDRDNIITPKHDIQESLVIENLYRLENDDDSDDDISLAVIVKQKQQNRNKFQESQFNDEINVLKCDTKTNERSKSNIELHDQHSKQTDEIISIDNKNAPTMTVTDTDKVNKNTTGHCLIITKTQHISGDSDEMKNKQYKKKAKKNHSDTSAKKVKIQDKKEIIIIEQETGLDKESDSLFEKTKNIKDNTSTLNVKEPDNISSENITDLSSGEVPENVSTNTSTANLKNISDVQEESQDIDRNKNKLLESKEESKNVRNVTRHVKLLLQACDQEKIYKNNEPSTEPESCIKQNCVLEQEDADGILGDDDRNSLIDNKVSNDALKTSNEVDIGLPLRRSKRGKSLYVEGNEQALIYSDTFFEQKAPLTKKQLIFSKLLLDEENSLKTSIPVNDNRTNRIEENNSCQEDKLSKSVEEKNKSVKRKKSPHSKKKSKKKKCSLSLSEHIISDEDVTKAYVENSCPKNFSVSNLNAPENSIDANPDLSCRIELGSKVSPSQNKFNYESSNEMASCNTISSAQQNKTTLSGSIVKRKIESSIGNHVENSIHSLKPKKSKLDNVNEVTLHSEIISSNKNNHKANHNLPPAARRARSKSVVVKSSGSMLYDPYDIDFEDMGDKTEPFRKQKLTLPRTSNYKLSQENNAQTCTTNEDVTSSKSEINFKAVITDTTVAKDSKENISDSDESSKSDVPLKKYVEEKERKNQLNDSGCNNLIYDNSNNDGLSNDNDVKQSRKKTKKTKQSLTAIGNVQKEIKDDKELSDEQLRSEQFMESFGFFSERKPRKSNLLATKKISETFHIIANESDDVYLDTKERPPKKSSRSENKRTPEEENNTKHCKPSDLPKLSTKYDKNLKLRSATLYCHLCKKEFRRTDNLVRHQMTLLHASKLSESAMKIRTAPVPDDLNYLVVFKQHIDRLRLLEHKMKSKKQSRSKFTLPTLHQILLDVRKSVREQQLARRNLSRDQALFLDCCELLKDSNRGQIEDRSITRPFFPCCPTSYALACTSAKDYDPHSGLSLEFSRYGKCAPTASNLPKKPIIHTSARLSGMANFVALSSTSKQTSSADHYAQLPINTSELVQCSGNYNRDPKPGIIAEITDEKDDSKSEGDVDSITAQNILESEEVRNLENDLLSGLKEAACKFQPLLSGDKISPENMQGSCPEVEIDISAKKEITSEVKNLLDSKEKKNLDIIENIDIFEDKFDKIKRKCRSQAAAAKLVQTSVEPSASHKSRKKSEKKKGKRNSKKYNQNTVLTKGALKGYDSIKVSILTSEIDMSAIVPPIVASSKKKRKRSSKKKRDRKNSALTRKLDSNGSKETSHKNIDVYEFLDNEEPEIFELRTSTVMERFRNLNKKDMQTSSKIAPSREELASSDSVSDGDDFVYMSDDYVCSDDETENSLMSCELGNVKSCSNEVKKSCSPLKRKDVMEKNAVMGKIFKHNALRSEKKSIKPKETTKPKANLDQLFDSLLEEEPSSSVLMNEAESPQRDSCTSLKKRVYSPIILSKYDIKTTKSNDFNPKKIRSPSPALSSDSAVSRRISSLSSRQSSPRRLSSSRYDIASPFDYEPSTSKRFDDAKKCDAVPKDYELTLAKKCDLISEKKYETSVSNNVQINDKLVVSPKSDKTLHDPYNKTTKDRSLTRKKENTAVYGTRYDCYDEDAFSDDAGVARQRARRKCTVGKQNILAETWSSESELDSVPPRPNSAESIVLGVTRKRKGRKREGQICGGRKGNKQVSVKKQDFESRVTSSNRNAETSGGVTGTSRPTGGTSAYTQQLSLPGPSGIGPRLRPTTSFWADGDEEPEHVQQHGWIVGDSHKKLVTMLAHAKGRKRNNDDKVRLVE